MEKVKFKDRVLPKYTKGEEIFNMVSHIVGAAMGVVATVLCIVFAAVRHNPYGVISGCIFGITMILLYTMSSIYHGLKPDTTAKRVFQVLDHCSIFLLIAGSYTPFCLCTLREDNLVIGWTVFGLVWTLAIIGIVLNSIDLEKYKVFSMICYLVMGWCVVFGIIWGMAILGIILNAIDLKKYKMFSMICYLVMGWCIILKVSILPELLGIPGFILLVSGGIVYTIGAILYGVGKKHKYMHSIFHLCIFFASLLQFLCILLYVM